MLRTRIIQSHLKGSHHLSCEQKYVPRWCYLSGALVVSGRRNCRDIGHILVILVSGMHPFVMSEIMEQESCLADVLKVLLTYTFFS